MIRIVAATAFMLGAVCSVRSQAVDNPKSFEAASVKPSPPFEPGNASMVGCSGGPGTGSPGLYTCHWATFQGLVIEAFGVNPLQIPYSAPRDHLTYDIAAKVPAGATREEFRLMLQSLLAERFKLAYHFEKKETDVYELTVAKGGSKLKESQSPPPAVDNADPSKVSRNQERDGYGFLPPSPTLHGTVMTSNSGVAHFVRRDATTTQMAHALSLKFALGLPVTDRTGLTGKYDFTLNFSLDSIGRPEDATPARARKKAGTPEVMPYAPPLLEILQSQLGLKLEKRRGSMDIFVIDHIEKTPVEQ
jgi:uncharacterized protein (TIGR03435 family)